MLEVLICSLVTVLPDYLFRRYVQGRRLGHEITLFSVWFELRYGIVACLMLTIALITVIFYHHPTSRDVTLVFRSVAILPEAGGRVATVDVGVTDKVPAGQTLFTLDDSRQRAAVETARRRLDEIDASMIMAAADIAAAEGQIVQAKGGLAQAQDELDTKLELQARNPDVVTRREIERLQTATDARRGALQAAEAARDAARARLDTLLPAEKASAEAQLAEAQVELDKTVIRAGVSGEVEQFILRVGDYVSPLMRPAGVLVPDDGGRRRMVAGFGQIEAQVIHAGMIAEATCAALPFEVIPMVITEVQDVIATGQITTQDRLIDVAQRREEGAILTVMEPLYAGGLDRLPRGARCVANAYTRNHGTPEAEAASGLHAIGRHVVDTVALVHAILLRIEALLLPMRTLVLGGH
jgi:multidrug resistance efflux pump